MRTENQLNASKIILSFWKEFDMPYNSGSLNFVRQLHDGSSEEIEWWHKTKFRRHWLKDIKSIIEFPTFETVMKVKEVIESTIDNWFAEYGDSY
jgi:hypothetical protein